MTVNDRHMTNMQSAFSWITVIHDISKQTEQRMHIGKIFAHWHLAIAITTAAAWRVRGSPEVPTICLRATKSSNKELVNKQQNSQLILHFGTNKKRLVVNRRQKNISANEGKQTSTSLEIHFCDFRCGAVEVSCLKMSLDEFNSLRKTSSIKTKTFSPALETLGYYCMW